MKNLDEKQHAELKKLAALKDDEINTDDIPEITDFSDAIVGKFYRPLKKQITLRIDADLLAWFKGQGKGYQTRINNVLRDFASKNDKPLIK